MRSLKLICHVGIGPEVSGEALVTGDSSAARARSAGAHRHTSLALGPKLGSCGVSGSPPVAPGRVGGTAATPDFESQTSTFDFAAPF